MDISKLVILLKSFTNSQSLKQGKTIHQGVITRGLQGHFPLCKALVNFYLSCHCFKHAKLVFQTINDRRDVTLWNCLMSAYSRNFMFIEALQLFIKLLRFPLLKPDSYTYPSVLKAAGSLTRVDFGQSVHAHVIKSGTLSDVVVSSCIVGMYAKCEVFQLALKVFDDITERDVACWNTVISCYYQCGHYDKALEIYEDMKSSEFQPNSVTLTTAISSCSRILDLERGKNIHMELLQSGFVVDEFVSAALVDLYGKCGRLEEAQKVFQRMPWKTVVAWNSMITGYSMRGDSRSCIQLFQRMTEQGTKPTYITLASLLAACSRSATLQHGKFIHGYLYRNFVDSDVFISSSLIDLYFKCESMGSAQNVFRFMPKTYTMSWNVMITGYSALGFNFEALDTFKEMEEAKIKPDRITLIGLLTACSQLAAIDKGRDIHKRIIENNLQNDEMVMGSLLVMYAKCGALEEANYVFNQLPEKDLVSWTSMITAYGSHGQAIEAMDLFERMELLGIKPDRVTFVAILSACSHAGLYDKGCFYFHLMEAHYGIEPTMEHFSCLIDLLGRAGRLQEAYEIMKETPSIRHNVGLLSTFFSYCHLHGNLQLGEKVAGELIKAGPDDSSSYILLVNIYAAVGKWEQVRRLRLKIRDLGLRKNPGCSWIEIDQKIVPFLAGDKTHPQAQGVHNCLQMFWSHMGKDELVEVETEVPY